MKLRCFDGKVRKFMVCRPRTITTAYGEVFEMGGLLEAECNECGEKFGCHDTYILKPKFIAHVCEIQNPQSEYLTAVRAKKAKLPRKI